MKLLTESDLRNIAIDLQACDIGEALTTGKVRQQYRAQRKRCMDALKADNKALGLDDLSIDDILAELQS